MLLQEGEVLSEERMKINIHSWLWNRNDSDRVANSNYQLRLRQVTFEGLDKSLVLSNCASRMVGARSLCS